MSDVTQLVDRDSEAPAPEELVRRAESLVPLLREKAVETEHLRRLPDESVRAIEEAGLFRMIQPVAWGGYGTDPATVAKVATLVASGCASTAWVMGVYGAVSQLALLVPDEGLAEVYSTGSSPKVAGVFGRVGAVVKPVEGGFRVSGGGHWPFNSGCHFADWDLLRVNIEEPHGSLSPAFCVVPMSDLTICDDWHVMGASGTGSNSVECGDLFIPEHRMGRLSNFEAVLKSIAPALLAFNTAFPLGMARHALDSFMEMAKTRGISILEYEKMGDAAIVQHAVATADVNIKLMEAFQQWSLSTISTGEEVAPTLVSAGQAACFRLARDAIERLFEVCPTDEIRIERPIQRQLRDLHTFMHQGVLTPYANYERHGRQMFAPL